MITLDFGVSWIGIKRVHVFGDEDQTVVFVSCLFFVIGIWRRKAGATLLQAIKNLDHSPGWIYENWPHVRLAAKKARARGRAEGNSSVYSYKEAYHREYQRVVDLQQENNQLRITVDTLRRLDKEQAA